MPKARLRIANPWTDGHRWDPSVYEISGVHTDGEWDGWVRCADPRSRVGAVYNPTQNLSASQMFASGMQYVGIGCHYRETGLTAARVGIDYPGIHEAPWHYEATPLVHITPGTEPFGFGAWLSGFGVGPQAWLVGTLGNPPEKFNVIDGALDTTPEGVVQRIELETNGTHIKLFLNGEQVSLATSGLDGVPVPAPLQGSTLHGAAYDSHLVTDIDAIPTRPAWRNWTCEAT